VNKEQVVTYVEALVDKKLEVLAKILSGYSDESIQESKLAIPLIIDNLMSALGE
jgi:hypothetical protein